LSTLQDNITVTLKMWGGARRGWTLWIPIYKVSRKCPRFFKVLLIHMYELVNY